MAELPSIRPLLGRNRVVPVLAFDSVAQGVATVRALAAGGVGVAEVTLRTGAGLDAIRAIRTACPDVLVGAGTILDPSQLAAVLQAGAQFIVTPGTSATMRAALSACGVPCLPGAATVSEMLTLREAGFRELKFFPAAAAGGLDYLKAVQGPCPDLSFCPTGGVGPANMRDYLALPNVIAVGGSWLTPKSAMQAGDWAAITRLAAEASA